MDKEVISTEKAPAAVGPYSQAIRRGDLIFTSGQLGLVPGTKEFAGPDIEAQTLQVLKNLAAVLEASGSSMGQVLKCTVFLADMSEFARFNSVYACFFEQQPPARSAVQAAGLPLGARVEIEAVAAVLNGCGCCREQ